VEPTPTYGPVQGAWPAAVFDGTQYLAVWEDHRLRRPILYGGRVTADGTALDPYGFRILDAAPQAVYETVYEPDVAFDGENFLVVTEAGGRIHGIRVSPAGEVLDPGGFLIADSVDAAPPSLVFDGEQYRVAWWQSAPGSEGIYQARVEPNGTVLDPGGVFVYATNEEYSGWPAVHLSFDGTNTLLSWVSDGASNFEEPHLLVAGRTTVDGTPLDDPPLLLSPEGVDVDLHAASFDGTNHVVAWAPELSGIRAIRVTPEGAILDPDGFVVADEGEYQFIHRMEMAAWDGRSMLVWSRHEEEANHPDRVRAAEIATDGSTSLHPADSFPRALEATVTAHVDGALMLWREGIHAFQDQATIVGTRIDDAGMPVGGVVAPASPASRQDVIAAASDGENFFILWTDTRDPTGRALHGARVGADGTPLDAETLQPTVGPVHAAHVVFDGANFVVTWLDPPEFGDGDSCASSNNVRVSPAGERLDAQPLKLSPCDRVAGASDGAGTLLVGRNPDEFELWALLLNQDGAVTSEIVTIPHLPHEGIAAAFAGSDYLVLVPVQNQLLGQRITQAGALEGQTFVIVEGKVHHVSVASGGGNHLVVSDMNNGIRATLVSSDGQLPDPDGVLVATLSNSSCWEPDHDICSGSSVVFDGENFVVAWRELTSPGLTSSLDLFGATVSPEGEVSPPFVISQQPEREGAPFLAANGEGQVLAAYNRFIPGPPYDTRRAVATLLPP
jgi:hypothetical protein